MFTSRKGSARVAAATALAAGAVLFATGSFLGSPSIAAPSAFLELDGNARSDNGLDWARSGGTTGSNGAFDGGTFIDAGTTPLAPSATASLTGAAGAISTAFVVDPLDVDANPCSTGGGPPTADPTVFTGQGGEKNGDRIDTMTFGAGSVAKKDDLSNVYVVTHRQESGGQEVFFGAERVVNDGDSHVDFEFLHGATARAAGCGGGFTGDRAQGDLVVSVDFTRGGTLGDVSVRQWHCAPEGDAQPADGTVCNPAANGPTDPHYEDVTTVPAIAAAVDVRVNALAAAPCGGWACRAADGTQVADIPVNSFLEGGIDLAATGFGGCSATVFPHTRTSQSFVSTLKDFAGPVPVDLCPPVTTTTTTESTTTTTTASTTTTSTTVAPVTTTSTAPATTTTAPRQGISARVVERPSTTAGVQVLGLVLVAPDAVASTDLPRTGVAVGPLLVWAGLAMMTGGALVLGARRRPE